MTDPIERLVDALDNLRVHQRQLDADGCEVGVSREALNEVVRAFGELSRRQSQAGVGEDDIAKIIDPHSFMPIGALAEDDGWTENMVQQGIDLARSKARRILYSLSVEPAGVEPVVWLSYVAFPPDGGDARYEIASPDEDDAFPVYTSPPPKAVTIADEKLIADARECVRVMRETGTFPTGQSVLSDVADRLESLTAALSSEAHNG